MILVALQRTISEAFKIRLSPMLIVFLVFLCSPVDFFCGGWYVIGLKIVILVELIHFRFPSVTALCRLLEISSHKIFLTIFRLRFLLAVFSLAGKFFKFCQLFVC